MVPSVPHALRAYDLQPPLKLLVPCMDKDRHRARTSVSIGEALLTRDEWGACSCDGEHAAGVRWVLRVPCGALPHGCPDCECGDTHVLSLSDADIANLRKMLREEG